MRLIVSHGFSLEQFPTIYIPPPSHVYYLYLLSMQYHQVCIESIMTNAHFSSDPLFVAQNTLKLVVIVLSVKSKLVNQKEVVQLKVLNYNIIRHTWHTGDFTFLLYPRNSTRTRSSYRCYCVKTRVFNADNNFAALLTLWAITLA